MGAMFYLGTQWSVPTRTIVANSDDMYPVLWSQAVVEQKNEVQKALGRAEGGIQALSARLGELQARSLRLDALGERLTEMVDLAADEFDFRTMPPIGGPRDVAAEHDVDVTDFVADLRQLNAKLSDRDAKLAAIELSLMDRQLKKQVVPGRKPIEKGWLSSVFGWRVDPITGKRSFHEGVDYAGRRGGEVVSAASGVVTWSGRRRGYGNVVDIKHTGGFVTRYAHNQENLVKAGVKVDKGQIIALIGSTGDATGPHVHFEILHRGKPVNPIKFVEAKLQQ